MSGSNRPVLIRSAMMMGLDVAPVAPLRGCVATSSGSTESSQSLVPQATSDSRGVIGYLTRFRRVMSSYANGLNDEGVKG